MTNVTPPYKAILKHLLLWAAVWIFYILFFSYRSQNYAYIISFSAALIPLTYLNTYIFTQKLVPDFLNHKKYAWFGLYSLASLLFSLFWIIIILITSIGFIKDLSFQDIPPITRNYVITTALVYFVVVLISYGKLWQKTVHIRLEKEKLERQVLDLKILSQQQELDYLKSQIHPHFLFNTLNTIYGFALQKSDLTADLILKLSSILDYILYTVKKETVRLEDEIQHIENYIALEQSRFSDKLKIHFNKEIHDLNKSISPMLFLPFVENSFKHGLKQDGILEVDLFLRAEKDHIYFNIKNTATTDALYSEAGIGLENIQQRLELLYPAQHKLAIYNQNQLFEVQLQIQF